MLSGFYGTKVVGSCIYGGVFKGKEYSKNKYFLIESFLLIEEIDMLLNLSQVRTLAVIFMVEDAWKYSALVGPVRSFITVSQ